MKLSKRNSIVITLLSMLLTPIANAQSNLEDLAQCVNQISERKGTFVQEKYLPILTQPVITSGEFEVDDQWDLVWAQNKPLNVTYKIEGQSVFRQLPNGSFEKQPLFEKGVASVLLLTLKNAVAGDFRYLSSVFDARVVNEKCEWKAELTPKTEELLNFLVKIKLKGNRELEVMELIEKGGDITKITLTGNDEK